MVLINIGVIGLGQIATKAHIPAIKKIPGAKLIAVADIDQKRLDMVKRRIHGQLNTYTDYNKMLENDDIDLISICLPPSLHSEVALNVLGAKKHILIEKPFASNLEEAFAITQKSLRVNRKVCLVQNYRYFPVVLSTKQKIEDGILGKILCVNTVSHVPPPSLTPSQMWLYSKWGVLDDYGPHSIDMTNWFISSNPSSVYCCSGVLKRATSIMHLQMLIAYENGSTATISVSWLAGALKFELSVMGTAGEIEVDVNLNQTNQHYGVITPYNQIKDCGGITKRTFKNIIYGTILKGSYVYHVPLINDFIKSIVENTEPPVTLLETLRNMAVSEASKMSLNDNTLVHLADIPAFKENINLLKMLH